jgi:hypothetical protein
MASVQEWFESRNNIASKVETSFVNDGRQKVVDNCSGQRRRAVGCQFGIYAIEYTAELYVKEYNYSSGHGFGIPSEPVPLRRRQGMPLSTRSPAFVMPFNRRDLACRINANSI